MMSIQLQNANFNSHFHAGVVIQMRLPYTDGEKSHLWRSYMAEKIVEKVVGYLLIIICAGMEVVTVLVWLGGLKPAVTNLAAAGISFLGILLAPVPKSAWRGG